MEKGCTGRNRKITTGIHLREIFMEKYKSFVFLFWINANQCVYMKQCRRG
jgi:hypothetical protein